MVSRRSLLRNGAGLVGAGAMGQTGATTAAPQTFPQPRTGYLLPADFSADGTGATDAQPALQRAIEVSARERLPLLINGNYALHSPLKIYSNVSLIGSGALRASHSGSMLTSGESTVSRVTVDGLRLEALPGMVKRAIEGSGWQYARLRNLRLSSAGGKFETGFYFTNVAYWNSVTGLEAESVKRLFDIGDANNLILDDINWCRFTDIGMYSFLAFHAPCSSVVGRGLSIEGVVKDTTLIKLDPACENIDLEFLRVEGSKGSRNSTLIDFNGSQGNSIRLPASVLGLFGDVIRNESGNFVINLNRTGDGATHLGKGQAVLPISQHDPSIEGALSYNSRLQRLRAYAAGARSVAVSPAIDPLDMNGHPLINVGRLSIQGTDGRAVATLSVDSKKQALQIEFADGSLRQVAAAAAPLVRGSRSSGEALVALLRALVDAGIVIDRTTP